MGSGFQREDSGIETKESMASMHQDFKSVKQACEARKNKIILNKHAFLNGNDTAMRTCKDNNVLVAQSGTAAKGETFNSFTTVEEPAKFVF